MMSVKKMIELYVTYELSEETWNMMREMTFHGLISNDNWHKFLEICKDWRMDDEMAAIIDSNNKVFYKRDEQGYLKKVA